MQGESLCIDAPTCASRLSRLFAYWRNKNPIWAGACHALVLPVGLVEHNDWDDLLTSRARALQAWLLGLELGDTLLAFVFKDQIHEVHVLAGQKKAAMLLSVANQLGSQQDGGPELRVIAHVKPKDEDGASQAMEFLQAVSANKPEGAQAFIGTLVGEKHKGPLVDVYFRQAEHLSKEGAMCFVDITAGCDELLRVKEADELRNHKKAALLGTFVMRDCVVPEMEAALGRKKRTRNVQIAEMAEEAIREPEAAAGIKLNSENCDLAYPAQVQSSGKFNLKLSAGSYKTHLHPGVIVASLGTRYNMYSGNISRTYLVDPTLKQMREYELLLEAQRAACRSLMDGTHPDSVSEAVLRVFERRGQEALLQKLSPSLGHSMGLVFKESCSLTLSEQGDRARPVSAGQVFNVCLSLNDLTDLSAAPPNKTYSMQLSDTVVVGEGRRVQVVTMKAPKDTNAVVYTYEQDAPAPPPPPLAPPLPLKRPRHAHCSSAASSGGSSGGLPSPASQLESSHNDIELLATEI